MNTGLVWLLQVSFDSCRSLLTFFLGCASRYNIQFICRCRDRLFFSGVFLSYIGLFWFFVRRVRSAVRGGVRGAACHVRMSAWEISYSLFASHMNVSCLNECVMSHMNVSCLIWMCHVSYEFVMSHMNGVMSHKHWVMAQKDAGGSSVGWLCVGVMWIYSCLIWMGPCLIRFGHVRYESIHISYDSSHVSYELSHSTQEYWRQRWKLSMNSSSLI